MRLGAILTMREIVEGYPELSRAAVDLLTAYLSQVEFEDEEPPADVQAIMALVIPRDTRGGREER